jgi:hypothetical protein
MKHCLPYARHLTGSWLKHEGGEMNINFFEEFPTKQNIAKLKLITWPCTVYIAAKSITEFKKIKSSITNKKITAAYWPVLAHEEGYWISPFSSAKAVKRVINEIGNEKVMWDAELPFRHPWFFLRIDNYVRNKPRIMNFFRNHGKQVATSEYIIRNNITDFFFKLLGVSFSPKQYGNTKIVMYYTSMHKRIRPWFHGTLERSHKKYGKNLQVGLGTIATGILGDERILSPTNLKRDLKEMEEIGVGNVVIFRLGGLSKKYLDVITPHASQTS